MSQDDDELKRQERDRLKAEILDELKRESLKKEILNELRPTGWKHQLSQLTRHPLLLLVFGFALTGGVGALLTAYSENKKWDYQQRRLSQMRYIGERVKQKRAIKEEVKKTLEASIAASEAMRNTLLLYDVTGANFDKELSEPIKKWEAAREQRVENYNHLLATFPLEFKNQDVISTFYALEHEDDIASYTIKEAVSSIKAHNGVLTPESRKRLEELNIHLLPGGLNLLLLKMEKEIQADDAAGFLPDSS